MGTAIHRFPNPLLPDLGDGGRKGSTRAVRSSIASAALPSANQVKSYYGTGQIEFHGMIFEARYRRRNWQTLIPPSPEGTRLIDLLHSLS